MRTPLLLYSDCPEGVTGLGRITRDLATHIYTDPQVNTKFEVATYGYGAIGCRRFPWQQYTTRNLDCIHPDLCRVWQDFTHGREGILMPIIPPSWMFSLVHPDLALEENPKLADTVAWLKSKPIHLWPYFAIESCGPGMKFNAPTCSTIVQCAKPLFYNRFGQEVAENSGIHGVPYIHHGIYTENFKPAPPETVSAFREELHCDKDTIIVGCCATNTGRKRFGLLFAAFADFQQRYHKNSKLWIHTSKMIDAWNIPSLSDDFGFGKTEDICVTLSTPGHDDQWMSSFYSTCDITILPTFGEGFGYPIMESQSCGTPCVTGSFACEKELVPVTNSVGYLTTEPDGVHNLLRPNYNYLSFSHALNDALRHRNREAIREHAKQWNWSVQWPKFKEWLLK